MALDEFKEIIDKTGQKLKNEFLIIVRKYL